MKDKKLIIIILLGLLAIGLTIWLLSVSSDLKKSEKENVEIQELIALEQEEMLNDLQHAQAEYDELKKKTINNDSLLYKLDQEQLRTQQLLEELQRTKKSNAANAAEIKRLKKEITTLRSVLRSYVEQVDELQRENTKLKNQNTKLIESKKKVELQAQELEKEKQQLAHKVNLAAQLDASGVKIMLLNSRGKDSKGSILRSQQICVSCNISKNVTAKTGQKSAYVRIMQPNGEPLTRGDNTIRYENRDITYSISRSFEFTGEEVPLKFFWNIEETLQGGKYQAFIFVDGYMIGSGSAIFEE